MTQTFATAVPVPEWILCPACRTPLYGRRWAENLSVCRECGHHAALTAVERLSRLLDPGYQQLSEPALPVDPLRFVDSRPYPERIVEAQRRTGLDEAVLSASGAIDGIPVVVAVMDFAFLGGSLGSVAGDRIVGAAEAALARNAPFIVVTASGGARMQEGAVSLMQMARTSAAMARLDSAGILTVSVISDPTYGGVAASFATLADIVIAEPGARLGFAGRRVIEQTVRRKLPAEFQTAEFLAARGFIDRIVPRPQQRREIARLLRVGVGRPAAAPAPTEAPSSVLVSDAGKLPAGDAWERVRQARDLSRPTMLDYAGTAFDSFQELAGDRMGGGDCPALIGGPAWLGERPVMLIGQQKGHTAQELTARNFGMPGPAGYRKAIRLMQLAEKWGIPVVTLIDTPGADPGPGAEEQGQAYAIAECLRTLAALRVPAVAVVIGEGGSGGALALAATNRVLILENGVYSVISPEGCAAILWKDSVAAPIAAGALGLTAGQLLANGVVDGVVPEPDGGAGSDHVTAALRLRAAVDHSLRELAWLSADELRAHRYARFARFHGIVPG